jgi:hypothetical protein
MSRQAKIRSLLLGRAPQPLCDACVADHLALDRRHIGAALRSRLTTGFSRQQGRCSGCCTDRRVTALAC